MPPSLLEPWIDRLQAGGRYTFLRQEAARDSGLSQTSVARALRQAVRDQRILQLKEYLFVIVPHGDILTQRAPRSQRFLDYMVDCVAWRLCVLCDLCGYSPTRNNMKLHEKHGSPWRSWRLGGSQKFLTPNS